MSSKFKVQSSKFNVQSPKPALSVAEGFKVQDPLALSDSRPWTLDLGPAASSSAIQNPQSQIGLPPLLGGNPQSWHCLSVSVPHDVAEIVASFLVELGSEGVIESECDLTQPTSPVTTVQGFFPLTRSSEELHSTLSTYLQQLAAEFPHLGKVEPRLSEISSEAWSSQWRGHFPPLLVGQGFLVLPPWESAAAWPERIALMIDPSMAFGTGHHATTQGCLEAIEDLCRQQGPPLHALDLGTGSGILAIALAKLGAHEVWATDTDLIALDEAQKNITANHVPQTIRLSGAPVEMVPLPFSFIVANLFSSTLISLASTLTSATTPHGHVILSGIQLDQEADILLTYAAPIWQLVTRYPKDEWVTIVLQRSAS
jgi:ribosomal protein L11 methyltransferase